MKPADFLQWLEHNHIAGVVTLSPGPFSVRIGEPDRIAAEVLNWLVEQHPELTIGQTEDILQSALWWTTLWAALQHCEGTDEQSRD